MLIELPVPDHALRRETFRVHTRRKPLAEDVDLDELAESTAGLVGADIEAACRRAALLAMHERIEKSQSGGNPDRSIVLMRHFRQVLGTERPSGSSA
jgi:transitional endoplasmic reticulum ATPase